MKIIQVLILSIIPFITFAQDANIFKNATVGFKITKPNKWQFATIEKNLNSLEKVQLKDEEFKQLMIKYSTVPLIALMKHPEPFDDLNPSFKVNIKPLGTLKGSNPKKILELVLPQFQKIFHDLNLIQTPTDTIVAELPAAYMKVNYSISIPDGRTFPTTSELWIVPRGNYFFMIGAATRQDEKTGSREEILEILSSIKL